MESLIRLFKRVLVLCPHPDDEFGCAGTVRRFADAGADLFYVAFSPCYASVPEPYPPDILSAECRNCTRSLGIPPDRVRILDVPVRHFPEHRQSILEHLVVLNREFRPDLVLLPSSHDIHQDHATIYMEGLRAFKFSSLLGYEMPQNLVVFTHSAFVVLTEAVMDLKIKALSAYSSQVFRSYSSADFIRGLARVRGVQCNRDYAEAFEVIRLIIP